MQGVELQIEDIAFGGKGVGRFNGKAVFVPFTIAGERVAAGITREKKQFAEAELEEILQPSLHRVAPDCPYFGRCGGCSYQHIAYEEQLAIKSRQVEQALRRIGKFSEPPLHPIIPSPRAYEYRNRITVHAERGVVGYYRRDAHRLLDVRHCPIAQPEVNAALAELRARRPRDGHYTLRARNSPRVFTQTNDEVGEALANLVAQLLENGGPLLIDAYCGSGFFSKRLREKFTRVIGIEWDRFAVAEAERDCLPNESYLTGDVAVQLATVLSAEAIVIVDPPAVGLTSETKRALLALPPREIVYVSCNPTTLARDLAELATSFSIESVTPLDMFPQTAEIECVTHLKIRP